MVRYESIRSQREKILSRIEGLWQFDDPIEKPLKKARQSLDEMRADLFLDLPSEEAKQKWEALNDDVKSDLHGQLRYIDERLAALDRRSRSATPAQKARLLAYAGILPIILFIPIFLCICVRAVPTPGQTKQPMAQGTPTPAAVDSPDTPAPTEDTLATRTGVALTEAASPSDGDGARPPVTSRQSDTPATDNASRPEQGAPPANSSVSADNNVHAAWVYLTILCLGAIGGCLRMIGSAVYYFGERQFYSSWLPYYYFAPLEGGLLAFIVCLLVPSGLVRLDSATDIAAPILHYGLAAFSGLFAKNVLRKLKDVADALFGAASKTDAA